MRKQITIGEHEGRFFLIGPDGFTTTEKKYSKKEEAEKAQRREQRIEDDGKPSLMIWEY